ncbi:fumarylacetoacetase [Sneathiella chinensis]|nr:fumarylacetoacetase [Sneathiella chinensis]
MTTYYKTQDPSLKSWVKSANGPECPFPIQNLPYGAFSTAANPAPRIGVAIGDHVLDLSVLEKAGLLPQSEGCFSAPVLNGFMGLGAAVWSDTRATISALLEKENSRLRDDSALRAGALVPLSDVTLHMPVQVGDFTDFYASREHATNVGTMFRDPENALMPNWLHIPIGYNGRASTVVVSGTDIHRPCGQVKAPDQAAPSFRPSGKLDMELEMGALVGTGNPLGQPVTVEQAREMIFGYVLLNDWSARDIQVWEYQPLGPFQAKAFATTISPWVVTAEALEPFRVSGPSQDPVPLPYLQQTAANNYDLNLKVTLQPAGAASPAAICETNFRYMYWSSPQQLAHHASSGCAMRPGDLLGSGTISGPTPASWGSLLELTWNGRDPLTLPEGQTRTFIEDGDSLTLTGWCQGDGYRIGFGEAEGTILPPVPHPAGG